MSILSIPAILLRSHPYSETSLVLRFYSSSHGVVSTIAKGARKKGGKQGASLSTFAEGILTIHFKESRDLQTFRDFSSNSARRALASDPVRFAGASLLGEIILQHAGSDENPSLFSGLSLGLKALETAPAPHLLPTILVEQWGLVVELGYAPSIQICVSCGNELGDEEMGQFDFAAGGIRCATCKGEVQGPRLGPGARAQLLSLINGFLDEELIRPRAHLRLASDFVTYHISGGTPLRSMEVLASLIPKDNA